MLKVKYKTKTVIHDMIVMERWDTEMETGSFGKNDQMDPNKSLRKSPHYLFGSENALFPRY